MTWEELKAGIRMAVEEIEKEKHECKSQGEISKSEGYGNALAILKKHVGL